MLFDTYLIVDWSAARTPKTGRDSIWICRHGAAGETVANPPTRHQARELLAGMLAEAMTRGERVLAGFDFPFGYPAGFARRLGLGGTPWRAVWDEIARLIDDRADNRNNRFDVAAALNQRVSGDTFPFWGRPVRMESACLGARHHRRHDSDGLREKRLIDEWMVGAQPCWKLIGAGSVGGQVLTGIPVVRALRDDPRWADRTQVWPFETGLGAPAEARIVLAEVWPSWWKACPKLGPPNDKAQVRTVARLFAARDRAGELASWFAPAIGEAEARQVVAEEAWTLGVTVPRVRAKPPSPPAGRGDRVGVRRAVAVAATPSSYTYLRDPAAIYRRSFALVREAADLGRFPAALRPVAERLAHAAGDAGILDDLIWSRGAVGAGRRALAGGAAILVDATMVAAGIGAERLPARNPVVCTLRDGETEMLATRLGTTRSAAAVELWRPHLKGSVVAIGNAPTALFHLLEMIAAGADRPALILGFAVGFVGAAEAKAALAAFGRGIAFIALTGRRGGSALAAAAVNALAGKVAT